MGEEMYETEWYLSFPAQLTALQDQGDSLPRPQHAAHAFSARYHLGTRVTFYFSYSAERRNSKQ
jgi:hypothetical protein